MVLPDASTVSHWGRGVVPETHSARPGSVRAWTRLSGAQMAARCAGAWGGQAGAGCGPREAASEGEGGVAELTVQERQRAQCRPLEPRRGSFMPHPGGAHCGVGGGGLGSSLSQTGLDDASFEFRQGVTLPVAKVEGHVQQAASSSRCQCVNRLGVCCWDRVRPAPGPRPLRLHRSVAFPGCPAAVHVSIPRGGPRVQAKAA